jgi:hypothetical protein
MTISKRNAMIAVLAFGLLAPGWTLAAGPPTTVDLSRETTGAEPKSLVPVVGI